MEFKFPHSKHKGRIIIDVVYFLNDILMRTSRSVINVHSEEAFNVQFSMGRGQKENHAWVLSVGKGNRRPCMVVAYLVS